jgi:hypothetical protein
MKLSADVGFSLQNGYLYAVEMLDRPPATHCTKPDSATRDPLPRRGRCAPGAGPSRVVGMRVRLASLARHVCGRCSSVEAPLWRCSTP